MKLRLKFLINRICQLKKTKYKFLISFILIFVSLNTNISSQITASFSSDTVTGCSPVYVTFNNLSTPSTGVSYFWDFGNGVTSNLKNPSNIYINSGNFDVKLIVTDGVDSSTLVKHNFIKINKPPKAQIDFSQSHEGCIPYSLNFNDISTPGDTSIKYWLWNFGDGNYSETQNPSHLYNDQGNFDVSLFVLDENGCSDYIFLDQSIKTTDISADFTCDNSFSCDDTLKVNFQNLSTGDSIVEYIWDFGNGQTSNEINPIINYSDTGVFSVSLKIKDAYGCVDSITKEDLISNQNVKSFFYVPSRINCANEATFFINNSKNAKIFHWDFGDGQTSTNDSVVHKYSEGGIYSAKLEVSNYFGCSDTYTRNVYVDSISANFITDKTFTCKLPDTIHYINNSVNATEFEWRFGNGKISFEKNPINILDHEGYWSDTLIAKNINGCKSKFIYTNGINSVIPKAYFIPNNLVEPYDIMGCVPNTVNFEDVSKYEVTNDSIISREWNFDDGTTSTIKNPSHNFTTLDTFLVTLKVTTTLGCSSEYSAFAYTGTKQHAEFSVIIPDTICASDPVSFTNLSQDENLINTNYWIFSDSTYSLDTDPVHFFQDTGYASVKLISYYNGCADDTTINNITYVNGPYHSITTNYNCTNRFTPTLNGNIKKATKFYWNFDDGSDLDSINENPSHTFPARGEYTVNLYAKNDLTGCVFSSENKVKIYSSVANFSIQDTTICFGDQVILNGGPSVDEHIFNQNDTNVLYLFNFGDNTQNYNSLDSIISYTYTNEGNYNIKLKIKDFHFCIDSTEQTVYVHKPHSSFTENQQNGCLPLNVNFTNTSTSYFPIVSNNWFFGDGNTSSSIDASNTYIYRGNFDVNLVTKDDNNCSDTIKKINLISTGGPIPNFFADKTNICLGQNITFSYSAQAETITGILWDFGDGNSSNEQSPTHKYLTSGLFSVSLTLYSDSGCDSTKLVEDYISVQENPIADFYADTTTANCYPLIVHFYDNSISADISSYTWNLGNNTISHIKNPSFAYLKPGDYDISLTVKTSNGCSNIKIIDKFISINGPYAEIDAHDTICKNIATDFSMKNQENINYMRWFFGEGGTSIDTCPIYTFTNSGYYSTILLLKSDSTSSCSKYIVKTILVRDVNTNFYIDSLTIACPPFELAVTDLTPNTNSRTWDFGDSHFDSDFISYHTYNSEGIKKITLYEKDTFGCIDTLSKSITVNPNPKLIVTPDTFICKGENIQLNVSGANNYTWYPQDYLNNPEINNPIANPDNTSIFNVQGISDKECIGHASTKITVVQEPSFLIHDTSIVIGDTVILDNYKDLIEEYSWSPTGYLTCSNCSAPKASPLESTYYTLTISDTASCFELSKTIYITVIKKYSLDVPTAFTPNGDGVNDIIYVDGWGIMELNYFNIYNRYGELVFSSDKLYNGWDGYYRGHEQPIETYRYNVSVKTFDGNTLTKTGTIKLLR